MENNFGSLYNTVRSIIKQNISFDINKDVKYKNILQKITDTLYSKNPSKNPTYLNSMIIEKAVPVLTKTIKTDTSSRDVQDTVNKPLFSTPRPAFTRNTKEDPNNVMPDSRFTALSMQSVNKKDPNEFNRMTNITSRDLKDTKSVIEKMQQLESERQYVDMNNGRQQFEKSVQKAHEINEENLKNRMRETTENEFFKNLYENNIPATKPTSPPIKSEPPREHLLTDQTDVNKLPTYDSNIENLKQDYDPKMIKDNAKEVSSETYQNSNFTYVNEPGKLIVLDSEVIANEGTTNLSLDLVEPFIVDKPCDVFLEFLSINNLAVGTGHLETVNLFTLDVDELPLKTLSTNVTLYDKYVIPNETYGTSDIAGDGASANATTYNVRLKTNYMCSIVPQTFSKFNVKFRYLAGTTHDYLAALSGGGRLVIGLYFRKRNN